MMSQINLPDDVLQNIFKFLDVHMLAVVSTVSRRFRMNSNIATAKRFKGIGQKQGLYNNKTVAAHAAYCIDDISGALSVRSIHIASRDNEIQLSSEEIQGLANCFYDTETNLKAKLRGIKFHNFSGYFTVLKEDSFLSKKSRRGPDERIFWKNADFEDMSPPKEVLSFMNIIEQQKIQQGDDRVPFAGPPRNSYAICQCGSIFVITRCQQRGPHAMRALNMITTNIAEQMW